MGRSHDNRRSPRSRVFLSAKLESPDRTLPVVLRDLSEHGALVEFRGEIEPGTEVLFRRNELGVPGRVAWVRASRAGVAFPLPLKAREVLRYIGKTVGSVAEPSDFRRPGVTRKGMSPEEQRWAAEMTGPDRRK